MATRKKTPTPAATPRSTASRSAARKSPAAKSAAAPRAATSAPEAPRVAAGAATPSSPALRTAAKTIRTSDGQPAARADKPKKAKLVRDSFTIPKSEYAVLQALKERAARLGHPSKKSELLRAGVIAVAQMTDAVFLASVRGVPAVKTGRPAKS